mgnify:CR=1 FL=1
MVASWGPHHGEEDALRGWGGSGTIFFGWCNLRCVYCQNWDISQLGAGREVEPTEIAGMMLELQEDVLAVRCARGPLANERVRRHRIALADFPSVRRALETRRPRAMLAHDHAHGDGDPYDGVLDLQFGLRQFVVGTGGAPLTQPVRRLANSETVLSAHGVLRLTLQGQSFRWDFLAADGGSILDSGIGACHGRP